MKKLFLTAMFAITMATGAIAADKGSQPQGAMDICEALQLTMTICGYDSDCSANTYIHLWIAAANQGCL